MSYAQMIVLTNGGLDAIIETGESLAYQDGVEVVMRDIPYETADPETYEPPPGGQVVGTPLAIEFDKDNNPILWRVQVRALQTINKYVGGWMTITDSPPEHPMDTVVIAVRSTEIYLNTLHNRLYALDNRLGIIPGTEIESGE